MITKENKKPCIGLDVSKGESHFQCFISAGINVGEVFAIRHSKEGFKCLLEQIDNLETQTKVKPVIVFENTGTYSKPIEAFCVKNKLTYYCIPPLLSAKTRKSQIRPTKTDLIDCETIANTYYIHHLNCSKPNSNLSNKLKTLCSYYNFRTTLQVKNKIKYREILDQVYPRIDCYFDVYSDAFLKLISKYPNPYRLKRKSAKELTEFFFNINYVGQMKANNLALLIKAYFKEIDIPINEDDELIHILDSVIKNLITIIFENEQMLDQIINLGMKTEEYKYLITIPGFQKNTAARVAAEIQGIDRFASSSKFVAYLGIDPTVNSSGKNLGEHLPITKKGNKRLRCLVYLVVVGTCKSTIQYNPIRDFVNKKKSDGLSPMAAYIAGCNKLARIIFAVCSKREYFAYK